MENSQAYVYIGAWFYALTLKQNRIPGIQQPTGENAGQKPSKSITTLKTTYQCRVKEKENYFIGAK